jgi:hypothetical protein
MSNDSDPLEFDELAPYRFQLLFNDASDADVISKTIDGMSGIDRLEYLLEEVTDGWSLTITSRRYEQRTAVMRVLSELRGAGVVVYDFTALDVVTDPPTLWLAEVVEQLRNEDLMGRRADACAGLPIVETVAEWLDDEDEEISWNAASVMGSAAFNGPGPEPYLALVDAATRQVERGSEGEFPAHLLLLGAAAAGSLASSLRRYRDTTFPEGSLPELIGHSSQAIGEGAISALSTAPGETSADSTAALCDVVLADGPLADQAAWALTKSAPSDELEQLLRDTFLAAKGELRISSAIAYCTHWPDQGRFTWTELLAARGLEDKWTGADLLAEHGSEEDTELAAKELIRLAKAKSERLYDPPRGAQLIEFLSRYPNDPSTIEAMGVLNDRRDKLAEELRKWIERRHPEIFEDGS